VPPRPSAWVAGEGTQDSGLIRPLPLSPPPRQVVKLRGRHRTLKRHLTTRGMTLADYKEKWGLPRDYPSTAPSYSAVRSQMAKTIGLGQLGGRTAAASLAKTKATVTIRRPHTTH
jgi:ROS/MUCR transcriptional regulator protein